jgi:hypothetical protein
LGSRGIVPLILNLGTGWRYVVNFTSRPTLEKEFRYPLNRLSGFQNQFGRFGDKNFMSLPGFEHKHCNNADTDSNGENDRSRMMASLCGSVDTGAEEDESSTGRFWAAGFHHVTAYSLLARVLKYEHLFL